MESSIPDLRPADGPAPIARRSLHDEVVSRVRDMMVECFETRDRMIRALEARDGEPLALVLTQHMERTSGHVLRTLE